MRIGDIVDIYELSPLQNGVLFDCLYSPGTGLYFEQLSWSFEGDLDVQLFKRAWEILLERHDILRTSFHWKNLEKPYQVVHETAELPWDEQDWSGLPGAERERQMDAFLADDRERNFNFEHPPLMRVAIRQSGPNTCDVIWSFHHLLLDGWSTGVLLNELFQAYSSLRRGTQPKFPPVRPYRDYIKWLLERNHSEAEAFWRKRLEGFSAPTPLKFCRALQSDERDYARYRFFLPEEFTFTLNEFARKNQITLNTLAQSAWALLLSRYCGAKDVLFGGIVSGRPGELNGVESMVGLFVNTLPVRVRVPDKQSVLEWLKEVQEEQSWLRQYEHTRLVDVRGWSDIPRNVPLFESAIGFQNYPIRLDESVSDCADGVRMRNLRAIEKISYPISLLVVPGRQLGLGLYYYPSRFDSAAVERLGEQFVELLQQISAKPDTLVRDLSVLTEWERQKLLVGWNATATQYPQKCVHELFEEKARRVPDALAVCVQGQRLSYAELNGRANQIASYLQKRGTGPDQIVAICVRPSIDLLVGVLGILKAGGAYLPLDPTYPPDRLEFLLQDAGAKVLLTQSPFADDLRRIGIDSLCLDSEWGAVSQEPTSNVPSNCALSNLAYMIYTSGSTGVPKGVEIEHRGLINLSIWHQREYRVGTVDRATQIAGLAFDASVWELWPYLISGASIHIPDEDIRASAPKLLEWLIREQITLSFLPTPLAEALLELNLPSEMPLRTLLTGGDRLRRAPSKPLPFKLVNHYGPTENTVVATFGEVLPGSACAPHIGKPVSNTRIYLLDADLRPVPLGAEGELCIAGDSLARGYHNRPELLAQNFVADPFSSRPGGRMYRTGDLARYLPDGNIEFIGRSDRQIKLRGFRIELGEIEAVLSRHKAVSGCVVSCREDEPDQKKIIAYVVPKSAHNDAGASIEKVSRWQELYDKTYAKTDELTDPIFNITGWNSSYTGQPIPAIEMREWVQGAVDHILTFDPKSVLEIGCGTGLLLFQLAPRCEKYLGIDFSSVALDYIRSKLTDLQDTRSRVTLLQRMANELGDVPDQAFDTVIINSVVQYFPNIEYLVDVLTQALKKVSPCGRIFLGDIRSLPLLQAFHTSVQLHQAADGTLVSQLRQHIQREIAYEDELVIDPAFFAALRRVMPRITSVQISPERGKADNELTRFRYHVVVHVDGQTEQSAQMEWLNWQENGLTLQRLTELLSESTHDVVGIRSVPNARVACDVAVVRRLATMSGTEPVRELRKALAEEIANGVDPVELWTLAEKVPYHVEVSWASPDADGSFDVIFRHHRCGNRPMGIAPEDAEPLSWREYANEPLKLQHSDQLVPELRSFVQTKLPEYMMPSTFVFLERFPLTPNGKIDRPALPAPESVTPDVQASYSAPRTMVEELLAGIWCEVLRLESVGIEDNFFELGGHSLLATQVNSRMRETLRVDLPLRVMFEAPTIASLAERIERERRAHVVELQPIRRVDRSAPLPLSFAQRRLWFLEQLNPGTSAYSNPIAFRITGGLDVLALQQALNEIIRRHESLRTTFRSYNGITVQVILPPCKLDMPIIDLEHLAEAEREAEALRLVTDESQKLFDLEKGPLLRGLLVRLREDKYILSLTTHHIISDGWSLSVLIRELNELYAACQNGEPAHLAALDIQYADFAAWQLSALESGQLKSQLAYWKDQLSGGLPVLELPTDRPRGPVQTSNGTYQLVGLPASLTHSLKALSRREGTTLFMTLLAGFQVLLGRYTNQDAIIVGSPVANRNRAQLENLIGFFVNMLPLRTDLSGDPSFVDVLKQVRDVALDAYANQDVPFEKIVEELHLQRDLSRNPVFQVLFALQNAQTDELRLPGLTLSALSLETRVSKFDLSLTLMETGQGLEGALEYNTDLFDAATVCRFFTHFQRLLGEAVADPDQRISELQLLSPEERQRIVVDWNRTDAPFPADQCLHELFEQHTKTTPDQIAAVFRNEKLTYAQLDARANQLAGHLRTLGAGPDKIIGISIERSLDIMVGLLGIMKAGAAYLPLDPSYPRERLEYMVSDSGIEILVTQEPLLRNGPLPVAHLVCLDRDWPLLVQQSTEHFESGVGPENLVYVIYTSGSTGRPKGVMIEHRGLSNLAEAQVQAFGLRTDDRSLQFASLSFDASIFEIAMALKTGAMVYIAPPECLPSGQMLADVLRDEAITNVTLSPSVLAAIPAQDLPALRTIVVAGEACPPDLVARWAPGRRFFNCYGPTETTVWASYAECKSGAKRPPIGKPILNAQIYLLDAHGQLVPPGVPGELCIGGVGVARGYLNRPDLTAQKFIPDPFRSKAGARLYKTGDLARYLPDGDIEFLGRIDHQAKIRGFRIELGEIESVLSQHPDVADMAVLLRDDPLGDKRLVAYVVAKKGKSPTTGDLRGFLREKLPEYMIPALFMFLPEMPLTKNSKIDRHGLPVPDTNRPELQESYLAPISTLEERIADVWRELLKLDRVGRNDNFFDLGGHSLLVTDVCSRVEAIVGHKVPVVDVFKYPTVALLAEHLGEKSASARVQVEPQRIRRHEPIAIVGMAGRFPKAQNLDELWRNLRDGVEVISFFSDEDLIESGIDPELLRNPNYVKAGAILDDVELFDAQFFGFNPREAEATDPQHRLFLECAHQALQSAGCDPQRFTGSIGVYAGASESTYFLHHLFAHPDVIGAIGGFQASLGAHKDFVPTRASYKLNLRGPSINVQTACSTSLVAVHLACRALLDGECDIALAGGVSVSFPQKAGYLYQDESILSPDGHCRAFDACAAGTVAGSGVGIVVLKPLSDAIRDGDTIHALIRGSAVNNDGSLKVSFTAPSVEGQSAVIRAALACADVDASSIGYVETHGTGTTLGDPIEFAALTQAFGNGARPACAIGSIKTNMGHLDAAAGVAGLIKSVLQLKHKKLVPSLHFEKPNPAIPFAGSPFYVNTKLQDWRPGDSPRRSTVSSFGIGGTNAVVVLEEAPAPSQSADVRPWHVLSISAKTGSVLETATENLGEHLREDLTADLADVAFTLHVGRSEYPHRRAVLCRSAADALQAIKTKDAKRVLSEVADPDGHSVIFMFSGQGSQHPSLARELYDYEPFFRERVDHCCELLRPLLERDLREVLFPDGASADLAAGELKQTGLTQPALFVIESALAELWTSWGIRPQAMIGHSIGEYVAAYLAGVMSLEDALKLVAIRGRLMQSLPPGAMLSVSLSADRVRPLLNHLLSIAAINSPNLCVVSGPEDSVAQLEIKLANSGTPCRRLHTSHAFHSGMMSPMLAEFFNVLRATKLSAPDIPYVSNLTGGWITAEQATDPNYWVRHVRETVMFADGIRQLLCMRNPVLLEVGPGQTLCALARQNAEGRSKPVVLPSLPQVDSGVSDLSCVLFSLARMWTKGVEIDWNAFYKGQKRRRIPLPTYPFERKRYLVQPPRKSAATFAGTETQKRPLADWFYVPTWKRTPIVQGYRQPQPQLQPWLILGDDTGLRDLLAAKLRGQGLAVKVVKPGEYFTQEADGDFIMNPTDPEQYEQLIRVLSEASDLPTRIVHLWSFGSQSLHHNSSEEGFYSLMFLSQALGKHAADADILIDIVSSGLHKVVGNEELVPEKATVLGACAVIPEEHKSVRCRNVDLAADSVGPRELNALIEELLNPAADGPIAFRHGQRWVQTFDPVKLVGPVQSPVREGGVYLITGGLGGVGLAIARLLARTPRVKLALLGRTALPDQQQWRVLLETDHLAVATKGKIRAALELQQTGAEVMVVTADVANPEQVAAAIANVRERFGSVNGVIHAAGVPGGGTLQRKTKQVADAVFAPKVSGTSNVYASVQGPALDFFVCCSSLATVLAGPEQSDYCGANAFLDSFAQFHENRTNTKMISINWDAWRESGMSIAAPIPEGKQQHLQRALKHGITDEEGGEAFLRVLASGLPQVVVSTRDLDILLRQRQKQQKAPQPEFVAHPRPDLAVEYAAPRNNVDRAVINIWRELLGVEQIGINDDFFELGGHSLLATQLLVRLREDMKVELPLRGILENSTVAKLSDKLLDDGGQRERVEKIAGVMVKIGNMSDDDVNTVLQHKRVTAGER